MANPYLLGIMTWLLPGSGYIVQGKFVRGALIAVTVWTMFIIALISGGAHYPGFSFQDGQLLYLLNVFARIGNGLGGVVSYLMAANPSPQIAALATFEYGGRFLEVAGLLNYLAALDVADIASGRKK
jgi:hypothetical protein